MLESLNYSAGFKILTKRSNSQMTILRPRHVSPFKVQQGAMRVKPKKTTIDLSIAKQKLNIQLIYLTKKTI